MDLTCWNQINQTNIVQRQLLDVVHILSKSSYTQIFLNPEFNFDGCIGPFLEDVR